MTIVPWGDSTVISHAPVMFTGFVCAVPWAAAGAMASAIPTINRTSRFMGFSLSLGGVLAGAAGTSRHIMGLRGARREVICADQASLP